MTMLAFNAEVPLSQLTEALTFLKARRMLCGGIHLFRSHDDEPAKGNQVCIKGLTFATGVRMPHGEFHRNWNEFCDTFKQGCVSLSTDNGATGFLIGPAAERWLPFNPGFFSPV